MKRVASCLAALTASSTTGVHAKIVSHRCVPHPQVIHSSDNAIGLAQCDAVDAAQCAAWLHKARPAEPCALKHMRPGAVPIACIARSSNLSDSLPGIRIERDESSGKLAEQAGPLPAQTSASHIRVGASGLSTGPHLYYEIWDRGKRVDPLVHKRVRVMTSLSPPERRRFSAYVSRMGAP